MYTRHIVHLGMHNASERGSPSSHRVVSKKYIMKSTNATKQKYKNQETNTYIVIVIKVRII